MKKKIFIFQQREWHNRIGRHLAEKLKNENNDLACLTFKKSVFKKINENYKENYELIVSHDDIIENPKKYILEKNNNIQLTQISKDLDNCNLWQIIQSARNHVKNYKDKFYYGFKQNITDENIVDYLKALHSTAENVFTNFKPDIILTPNFVSLPHIVFNLYFKKKGIKMFGTADCKVAGKDIFVYDYLHKDSNFIRFLENNKEYKASDDQNKKILEIIQNYKVEKIKKKYLFISDEYKYFPNFKKFILRFFRDSLYSLIYKNFNKIKGIGPTPDDRSFFIVIRDFITFFGNLISERFFTYDKLEQNQKFAFYPLQVQPEASLDVLAPLFNNQIETARQIAMQLPSEFTLVVKDHPNMYGRRPVSYLDKIRKTPNVKLIDFRHDGSKILSKSEILIASTGSIIMEAAILEKPCLQLGELGTTLYLPNVFKKEPNKSILDQINEILLKKKDEKYEKKLKNYILAGLTTGHDAEIHRLSWINNKEINNDFFYKLIKQQIQNLTKKN